MGTAFHHAVCFEDVFEKTAGKLVFSQKASGIEIRPDETLTV